DAIPLFERTLELRRVILGSDHLQTTVSMNNLGSAYRAVNKPELAIALFEEALKRRRANPALAPDHLETLHLMINLASALSDTKRFAEAVATLDEALRLMTAKPGLGRGHPDTMTCMHQLGVTHF